VEQYGTATQATDNIIRRMNIARWIPKTTNTHSEYVTLIDIALQTLVVQTLLDVTLYVVQCLSCLALFIP
jgi:hypothetical protein